MHLLDASSMELQLVDSAHGWHLSPAYDQLNTRLVILNDSLALPVGGKRNNLKPQTWEHLAQQMGIGKRAARRVHTEIGDHLEPALRLIQDSPWPETMHTRYAEILVERHPHP